MDRFAQTIRSSCRAFFAFQLWSECFLTTIATCTLLCQLHEIMSVCPTRNCLSVCVSATRRGVLWFFSQYHGDHIPHSPSTQTVQQKIHFKWSLFVHVPDLYMIPGTDLTPEWDTAGTKVICPHHQNIHAPLFLIVYFCCMNHTSLAVAMPLVIAAR